MPKGWKCNPVALINKKIKDSRVVSTQFEFIPQRKTCVMMITPHLHVSTDSLHHLHDRYSVYPSQWTTQDERKEQAATKEFQSCVKGSKMQLKGKCIFRVNILGMQADKKLDLLSKQL